MQKLQSEIQQKNHNSNQGRLKRLLQKRLPALALALLLALLPLMESKAATEDASAVDATQENVGNATQLLENAESAADEKETIAAIEEDNENWETIYITSVEDLKKFARNCWLDTWSQNKKVYLTADLDLTNIEFSTIPTFGGYFDGKGYTINGLNIEEGMSYAGLFNYTQETAIIVNLNVEGTVTPSGKQIAIGGIVGDNRGLLQNCSFDGTVKGNDYTGSVVGFNEITGSLVGCVSHGTVNGMHFTGGIAGQNLGNIKQCTNYAAVNTSNIDPTVSLDDINVQEYASNLLNGDSSDQKSTSTEAVNSTVDTGGIAGNSTGVIQYCTNQGIIGYEHVGYNVGGIAGRQSGYILASENKGEVYGRKDVGGITGQAEPYVAVDFSEDIAMQLSENIQKLHDLISQTIADAGDESDTVSSRLSVIKDFTDKALSDTSYLADSTIDWTNGMVSAANEAISRVDYIMDESAKKDGILDQANYATGNVKNAVAELNNVVSDLDIYQYMTPDERTQYDQAKKNLEDATSEHAGYVSDAYQAYSNYYIDKTRTEKDKYNQTGTPATTLTTGTGAAGIVNSTVSSTPTASVVTSISPSPSATTGSEGGTTEGDEESVATPTATPIAIVEATPVVEATATPTPTIDPLAKIQKNQLIEKEDTEFELAGIETGVVNEKDLRPILENGKVDEGWTGSTGKSYVDYVGITGWVHYVDENSYTDFPDTQDGLQKDLDQELISDAASDMAADDEITTNVENYANKQYSKKHGNRSYTSDITGYVDTMTSIILAHTGEMTSDVQTDATKAVNYARDAAGNLQSAGSEAKNMIDNLNGRDDISLPTLSGDYRLHTDSLVYNLQGLSDNMGYLNGEMSTTSDVLLADFAAINDQFNVIMLLYTDAIDGVLDMDYSSIYEDHSNEVAEDSVDATIVNCLNRGTIKGDLDVAGIAGTMAIEYDFDLESDVTGIDNAKANSTYETRCVLRNNINRGEVTSQKSYVGGTCGLQEMGTILKCENYGKIQSTAGDYVGGIAGQSYSTIQTSFAKCLLQGGKYVAGIVGEGNDISDCAVMARVQEADAFYGAVAGTVEEDGEVIHNFFVGDDLAGIDRISYTGKAEPVSYETLLERADLPADFEKMTVSFYLDDKLVKKMQCNYGDVISEADYPILNVEAGSYAAWNTDSLGKVIFDEMVTAESTRYDTTLASELLRENGQSVFLIDGAFESGAKLGVTECSTDGLSLKKVLEHYTLALPADGDSEHVVRYQPPKDSKDEIAVYLRQGDKWTKLKLDSMGSYSLFNIEGTNAEIAVVSTDKGIMSYLWMIIVGVVVVMLILALLIIKKKKKVVAKKKANKAQIEDKKKTRETTETEEK